MPTNTKRKKRIIKEIIFVLLVLALLVYGVLKYKTWTAEKDLFRLSFVTSSGAMTPEFKLLLANTKDQRARGLKYKKPGDIAEDGGMFFIYPTESVLSFWMKDTYISLDMIFIGSDERVVGVLHNVPILNEVSRKVESSSKYVVELLAGTAKKYAITKGAKMSYTGALPNAE